MFSGIVERTGTVRGLVPRRGGARLTVAAPFAASLVPGASVCVAGACLTVAARRRGTFEADLVPETLRRTTLGRLRPGDRVNLERSLRLGDRVEGHLVQGHVEGLGLVTAARREGPGRRLRIMPPPALLRGMIPKGSIAVDGVSLTVAALGPRDFEAALIPVTLARTTLGGLRAGDRVNLETDLLARYAARPAGIPRRGSRR